jgi:adenylate cyclase
LGMLHFMAGRYEEAIVNLSRSTSMSQWVHCYLAACFALKDHGDQAAHHIAEALRLAPDLSIRGVLHKEPFKKSADQDRLAVGLRKAGLPE